MGTPYPTSKHSSICIHIQVKRNFTHKSFWGISRQAESKQDLGKKLRKSGSSSSKDSVPRSGQKGYNLLFESHIRESVSFIVILIIIKEVLYVFADEF